MKKNLGILLLIIFIINGITVSAGSEQDINLALNRADSITRVNFVGGAITNIVDGDYGTSAYFNGNNMTGIPQIQIGLCDEDETAYVKEISVVSTVNSDKALYYSLNGETWTEITDYTRSTETVANKTYKYTYTFPSYINMNYISFESVQSSQSINEVEVMGYKEYSTVADSITLSDSSLAFEFDSSVFEYNVILGDFDEIPTVSAESSYDVEIEQATEETMQATVTVINGMVERTYTINFERENLDENNARLESIILSSGELVGGFNPQIYEYTALVQGAIPTVQATAQVSESEVTVTQADTETKTATIHVVSQSGIEKTYTVRFVMIAGEEQNLALNRADSISRVNFSGGVIANIVDGDYGTTAYLNGNNMTGAPEIQIGLCDDEDTAYVKEIAVASTVNSDKVISYSLDGETWTKITDYTRSNETVANKTYKYTYTFSSYINMNYISFTSVQSSQSINEVEVMGYKEYGTVADSITLSAGELNPAFSENIFEYTVEIGDFDEIPTVSAESSYDVEVEQATQETMQATVTVINGEIERVYTINFERENLDENNAKLENISLSEGELAGGFNPHIYEYSVFVEGEIPTVEATAQVQESVVTVTQATMETKTATIRVVSQSGVEKTYTVNFITGVSEEQNLAFGRADYIKYINCKTASAAANIVDDDCGTQAYFTAANMSGIPQIQIDLCDDGVRAFVKEIEVVTTLGSSNLEETPLQYSLDGINWKTITDFTLTSGKYNNNNNVNVHTYTLPSYIEAEYISFTGAQMTLSIFEIEVTGKKAYEVIADSITLSDATLTPSFSSGVFEYAVTLGDFDEIPTVSAVSYNDYTINIVQATEETMKATVTVVNGELLNTYTITFNWEDLDENNVRLSGIELSDYEIQGGFDAYAKSYIVLIPDENTYPSVLSATPEIEGATVTIINAQPTRQNPNTIIRVTSPSGSRTAEYPVHFVWNNSLKKNCNGSSTWSANPVYKGTDGRIDTCYYNSTSTTYSWITVDLENVTDVKTALVYTLYTDEARWKYIYYSDDGFNWVQVPCEVSFVQTEYYYLNSEDIPIYLVTLNFKPFTARYVKSQSTIPCAHVIQEFEVYGQQDFITSNNTYVDSITLSHGDLYPNFSKYKPSYTVTLPSGSTLPEITSVTLNDSNATYEIVQPTMQTLQGKVIVTAENGLSKRTYTVKIDMDVPPTAIARLSSLSTSSGNLTPVFNAAETAYRVYISENEVIPTVSAVADGTGASVAITQATEETMRATVVVTSGDRQSDNTYTIDFYRSNLDLQELNVTAGSLSPLFDPAVTEYTVEIPSGEPIPEIGAVSQAQNALISIVPATESNLKSIVTVTSIDGIGTKTYTVTFRYMKSLEEVQIAVLNAVNGYTATNRTTADDIMALAKNAAGSDLVEITWSKDFDRKSATSDKSGSVTGELTLTLNGKSVKVTVSNTISKLTVSGGSSGGGGGFGGGGGGAVVDVPKEDDSPSTENPKPSTENIEDELTGHWGESEIRPLVQKGIVQGDGNSLNLDGKVTRAEFITMLIRGMGIDVIEFTGAGADVNDADWFADYIQTAVENNFLQGYDGNVRPNDPITREEAAKVLVSAFEAYYKKEVTGGALAFTDKDNISPWAKQSVEKAVETGLIKGFETGEFAPKQNLKREQAMVMVYRLLVTTEN